MNVERRRVMTPERASELVGRQVPVPARETWIHGESMIVDPDLGDIVIAYLPLPEATVEALRWAVRSIGAGLWGSVARAGGLRCRSTTFGMAPRRMVYKRDACRTTRLANEAPDVHAVLANTSLLLGDMLAEIDPAVAERDRLTIAEIEDEWRMAPGSQWTSGVVNATSQLPYHRDRMNFDAWAAMPVIRSGVSGGGLHIPEYDLALTCRDGYAVFFNGHRLVHGVTPITGVRSPRNGKPAGYRYSIVYYALRGMKDCATFAAELSGGQERRTAREVHEAEFVTGTKADWR